MYDDDDVLEYDNKLEYLEKPHTLLDEEDMFDDSCNYGYGD